MFRTEYRIEQTKVGAPELYLTHSISQPHDLIPLLTAHFISFSKNTVLSTLQLVTRLASTSSLMFAIISLTFW